MCYWVYWKSKQFAKKGSLIWHCWHYIAHYHSLNWALKGRWYENENKRALEEHLFDHSLAQSCCQDLCYFLWSNVTVLGSKPSCSFHLLYLGMYCTSPLSSVSATVSTLNFHLIWNDLPHGPLPCQSVYDQNVGRFSSPSTPILKSTRQVSVTQAHRTGSLESHFHLWVLNI